jgi:FlaA1/EpsC-like NDP-sugar epimerase
MPLCLSSRIERITSAATGRQESLFSPDCAKLLPRILESVAGKRILVAGGAGSIGSATLAEMLGYRPSSVCVLDTNENNLTELVRAVRSQDETRDLDIHIEPLDYGSMLARKYLSTQLPFDLVLSFAALKHVRSERDEFSLLRMLEVNLLSADRFLATLREQGHGRSGVFFVSTDKAAFPVSLMGASKRVMELLLLAHAQPGSPLSFLDGGSAPALTRVTFARFANVAFSDGSLPWGFLQRIEKGQPLSVPGDVRRYLLSPAEAGQLCLLASVVCPDREVLIPKLHPQDAVRFTAVAEAALKDFGWTPAWYSDPGEACRMFSSELAQARYPVLVTHADTAGEKEIEEFVGPGECPHDIGLSGAFAVPTQEADAGKVGEFLSFIRRALETEKLPTKADLVQAISVLVPELLHRDSPFTLDSRM